MTKPIVTIEEGQLRILWQRNRVAVWV